MVRALTLLGALLFLSTCSTPDGFDLSENAGAKIFVTQGLDEPTMLAVADLQSDLEKITGNRPPHDLRPGGL